MTKQFGFCEDVYIYSPFKLILLYMYVFEYRAYPTYVSKGSIPK